MGGKADPADGRAGMKAIQADVAVCPVKKPFQTRPTSLGTKKSPGFCVTGSAVATTEALFKLEDAIVIQRYCDKCLPNAEY